MTRREYAGGAAPLVLTSSIGSSDTSIGTTGTATGWPTGGVGKFLVVIDRGLATEEKLLVESRSGNTLTLASASDRGQDDTAAASHLSGATVEHVLGAIDLDEANAHVNNTGDDNHTQYYNASRLNTAHDIEARHTFGAALGTPSAPVAGGTASAGSGDNPAREDHVHPLGIYADFTPVFTQGATTFTTGGTGRYTQIGKLVHYYGSLVINSGTGSAFGDVEITTPVRVYSGGQMSGRLSLMNSGEDVEYLGSFILVASNPSKLRLDVAWGNRADPTGPEVLLDWSIYGFTLGVDDFLDWDITYEAL